MAVDDDEVCFDASSSSSANGYGTGSGTGVPSSSEDLRRVPDHVREKLEKYYKDAPAREKQLREWGLVERAEKLKNWQHDLTGFMTNKDLHGNPYVARHEKVTKTEEERMHLNGETKEMLEHVKTRWKEQNYDTSIDAPWVSDEKGEPMSDGDPNLAWKDTCVWVWTIFWLAPKLLAFFIPMYLLSLLPILVTYIYTSRQEAGLEQLERNGTYWFVLVLSFSLYVPVIVLACVSLFLDYFMYYLFGFFFTLFTCRWGAMWRSHRAIDPYRGGPSVFWKATDIFCCIAGQTMRHGCAGTIYNLTVMWTLIPWLKYFWNCNPWVYNLDERYVQQISTKMEDLGDVDMGGIDHICDTARRIISRAKQYWFLRVRQDYWHFVPHYPYPPAGRRWAIGMQCGGSASTYVSFTLLVHTTHANSDHGGSSEQFLLSNSVHPGGKPVYRVMLWYNNPYHFLTGFVEASISNGGHSQPQKFNGGEHPMWLVTSKSPLMTGRESLTGSGMIDGFFDEWLPLFVHECRRQGFFHAKHDEIAITEWNKDKFESIKGIKEYQEIITGPANELGKKMADSLYEEVVSVDGISAGCGKIGRAKYDGKDKLTEQEKQDSNYMSLMHSIVNSSADGERELLLNGLKEYLANAEEERQNLKHLLDLSLCKFAVKENDSMRASFLERKWIEQPSGADGEQPDVSQSVDASEVKPCCSSDSCDSPKASGLSTTDSLAEDACDQH